MWVRIYNIRAGFSTEIKSSNLINILQIVFN